ncbi:MAG: GNAT family N-acetyltransferase [Nocardioidaceae bacterium]
MRECRGPAGPRTSGPAPACAITCLFARAGFRRQGISRTLIHAAIRLARDRGAQAIEAYPDDHAYTPSTRNSTAGSSPRFSTQGSRR